MRIKKLNETKNVPGPPHRASGTLMGLEASQEGVPVLLNVYDGGLACTETVTIWENCKKLQDCRVLDGKVLTEALK